MLPVFKETEAAKQIARYGEENDWSDERVEEVILSAYNNACENGGEGFDALLFKYDVKGTLHYLDIDTCFIWSETLEGGDFWKAINDV